MSSVRARRSLGLAAACLALALVACSTTEESTPQPTTFPMADPDAAAAVVKGYLDAWAAGDHEAMYAAMDPDQHERYPFERFRDLHVAFSEMADAGALTASAGPAVAVALPPEPRSGNFPPPSPTPVPTPDPSSSPGSSATAEPTAAPTHDPDAPLPGPVPALSVPIELAVESARFGDLELERALTLVQGPEGWLLRWSPEVLFAELGPDGELVLERELGARGRIIGDGVVWAETRDDGARAYPQQALAGQAIGFATEVTAEDLETLAEEGYRAGDVVGRSGLEAGAEDLLRGTPGWRLLAVSGDGERSVLYETGMVPGADVSITLRPEIQAVAEQGLAGRGAGATAAVDPATGDVWALASTPLFNPNAMTIGTTLGGVPLEPAGQGQVFNKAVLGAYPAGSSFKPFTLAAALDVGIVTPSSTRTCPPAWRYSETFTFHNYEDHTLPGQVTLAQAMAFSCNTTYMPLAFEVYQAEETALTDLLFEFGFGAPTGIGYVIEEIGVVPDDEWLAANGRGGFTGFEQVQLAIGQGAFLGTPLQLANAYAAIGNGGTLWQTRILTEATLPDGTVVESVPPTELRQVSVSAENLAYVTDALEAVTTLSYGTATPAFAGFGVDVAGKSGTAETGQPDPHAWFPAYAPADAPTISVATVLLNIPLGTGGADAAPLVRQVMAAHFN